MNVRSALPFKQHTQTQTDRLVSCVHIFTIHVNINRLSIPFRPALLTRQLSYRKEDRAMRPIYGCPQKF